MKYEEYEKVEFKNDSVVMHMKSGKQIKSDVFLFANGRTGNSKELGLDKIGINVNGREQIEVISTFQRFCL